MVDEDRTNWDPFFLSHPSASGFEGATPVADGYSAIGATGGTYVNDVKLLGTKSMRFSVAGESTDLSNQLGDSNAFVQGQEQDMWLRAYARWRHNSGAWPNHLKLFIVNGGFYLQPEVSGLATGAMPDRFLVSYDAFNHYGIIPSGPLTNDQWVLLEARSNHLSDTMDVWIDGQLAYHGTDNVQTENNFWVQFGVPNACCTAADFSLDNWLDGLAVSSARVGPASTIEIANSSDYATATKVYQEPLFLSDGSVQVKADLTGLGAGPYYLFVTNNRQERSTAYLLGGADTTPPGAPSGLGVQ
jgi:hypothetical protein